MTGTETETVWTGAEALRPFLVPLDSLEPFPGNPRRGDVEAIRASLRRFGQVKPILVDGARIIAHHHVRLAAQEEGWTHVAAIANAFATEDEQRAYMLADNRLADRGEYDTEALVEHLRLLADIDALAGTGYSTDDLDEHLAALRRETETPPPSPLDRDGKREHRDPDARELVLMFSGAQLEQMEMWMGVVAHEKGTVGTSETVYAALEVAARTLNRG